MKKIRLGLLMLAIVLGVTGAIAATKQKPETTAEKWQVVTIVSENTTQIVIRGYNIDAYMLGDDYECVTANPNPLCTVKGVVTSKFVYTNPNFYQVTISKVTDYTKEWGVFTLL